MFFYDSTFIILLPALIISALAQIKVKATFEKYYRIKSINGYTGAQVARTLLDAEGLYDVEVKQIAGKLTDHYDPRNRMVSLSRDVYGSTSIASIGVAAHETGHAIQHQKHYAPLQIRNSIVPVVNFSSNASWIIFLVGFLFRSSYLINLGILLFTAVVIFQLVTLPVEFNASNRALRVLQQRTILYDNEIKGAKSVLTAAAMTYIAAALMSILQLIRLFVLSRDR
ncbi:zinc metallopeptidase [Clostridium aestuarii]|uniref:Zinc metallopeptidase n=1 Tax=Clostridium aestuarii TaxID=338193 RepID=A0ABT4CYR4_9CLOT|nr:zinc metallopeptidase [Clostridium aestuarii]MCY6484002.1 zinc metallopeptidase [Clostridium aestuarii]